jgi:hypothetical protein
MKISLVAFLIVTLTPLYAFCRDEGGLFVEPGLTYQMSESQIDYPAPLSSSSKADNNGLGVMARLGFHISESFFLAADGRYSWLDFDDEDNNFKTDAVAYNLAPVLGLQMSEFGLRIWGAYILTGQMDLEENGGNDFKFSDASGYRIGAGFRIFSLSLNLEYEDLSYGISQYSSSTGSIVGSSSDLNLDTESYILSVSFPLEL